MSGGFEIETEMTIHGLDKRMMIVEMPVECKSRTPGNISKLNTFKDGDCPLIYTSVGAQFIISSTNTNNPTRAGLFLQ